MNSIKGTAQQIQGYIQAEVKRTDKERDSHEQQLLTICSMIEHDFVSKARAFSYGFKAEVEATINYEITDDEFVEFMDSYLSDLSESIQQGYDDFKEQKADEEKEKIYTDEEIAEQDDD